MMAQGRRSAFTCMYRCACGRARMYMTAATSPSLAGTDQASSHKAPHAFVLFPTAWSFLTRHHCQKRNSLKQNRKCKKARIKITPSMSPNPQARDNKSSNNDNKQNGKSSSYSRCLTRKFKQNTR